MSLDFSINIVSIVVALTVSMTISWYRTTRRKKYYLEPDVGQWIAIDDIPIDYEGMLLLTDGKDVRVAYSLTYNRKGDVVYSDYRNTIATHWRPMPEPPNGK